MPKPIQQTKIYIKPIGESTNKSKQEVKKEVLQATALQEKTFIGKIKIKNFSDGFIKCSELDKDVAFGRMQLKGCDMIDIEVGTAVEIKIRLQNGKPQTNTSGNNYKASEVKIISKE